MIDAHGKIRSPFEKPLDVFSGDVPYCIGEYNERPVLFTEFRVNTKRLPSYLNVYMIRVDDYGDPNSIEPFVCNKYYGTIITPCTINMNFNNRNRNVEKLKLFKNRRKTLDEFIRYIRVAETGQTNTQHTNKISA